MNEQIDKVVENLIEAWAYGEPMDGDAVDELVEVLRYKINVHEGNLTGTEPPCPICGMPLINEGNYKWDCQNGCLPLAMEQWQIDALIESQ